ncbi:MAG TPA: hypothetical protein VGY98_16930 [Verrucomicrobiae bacterium]|nr:hypothetical protein [Verrucomicrobiae bacterium]
MSRKLVGVAFGAFLLVGVCIAQPTNGLQSQSGGVTLSISVTNSSYAVGSDMAVFAVVRNKSTNDLHLGSCIVSLTGDSGKAYQLTQPELGNRANLGGDIVNLVTPGQVHKWQIRVGLSHYLGAFGMEWINKNIEPGAYMLKAVQYYDGDKLRVQSNVLNVRIEK